MNKEMMTALIRQSAQSLETAAQTLGAKASWSPLDKGRTAVDQLAECGGIMLFCAQTVTERACPPLDRAAMQAAREQNDTPDKALALMRSGADALAAAVDATPGDVLASQTVTLPFGAGMTKTLAEVVLLAYWNNTYHEGQINYIGSLAS